MTIGQLAIRKNPERVGAITTDPSEGIADGKKPSEVVLEVESGDGPFARTLLPQIVGLEARAIVT